MHSPELTLGAQLALVVSGPDGHAVRRAEDKVS